MKNTFLPLSDEDKKYLKSLSKTRTIQAQVVDRARILLYKADGVSFDNIAARLNISKRTVCLCISKFNTGGLDAALFDAKRSRRPAEVSDDAKAWIINLACQRPADLGYSQELWTLAKLHKHIQQHAQQAGFPRLTTITKTYVQKLLQDNQIKPFKIKFYCEKRDPDFESKMHEVLVVYKQVEMQFDEKPGIQAIANTSKDLRPTGDNGEVYRDYEYKRLGTVSLLAGIDLLTGEAIPLVRDTHKSSDFIDFLKILDKKYPSQDTIRIILDNHSAHTSKETKRFLATMPKDRFAFVFTPKHGSWLNMIEGFFGKMTKQMLRGIRVNSKQELVDRIYQYFDEINKEPVVYHWKYKMDDIEETESASV